MCTWIVEKAPLSGSAKGHPGWFTVTQANVCYDHPTHALMENSLNIDFVNEDMGPGARVAVELNEDSARALVRAILVALDTGATGHGQPARPLSEVVAAGNS
jgi:hypothetical protein